MNQINISAKIVAGTNRNKRTKATSTTNLAVDGAPAASSGQPIDVSKFVAKDSSVLQTIASPIAVNGAFSATSIAENGVLLSAKYITPAGVDAKINAIINAAPTTLDTLSELATALGNDPNFATTITNLIGTKAPLASPNFSGIPLVNGNAIFHAGNANLPTIDWTAKNITASSATINGSANIYGTITGVSGIISLNGLTDANAVITESLPVGMRFDRGSSGFLNTPYNANNANGLLTLTSHLTGGTGTYGKQLFFTDNEELYIRRFNNGTALPWRSLYHSGNANLPTVDWTCRNLTANGQIVSSTSTGNINIGSQNSDWIHFYSTLPNFFSQKIRAVDSIGVYGVDNYLHNNGLLLTQGDARIAGVVKSTNQNGSGFTASGWQIGDYSNLNNLDVRSRLQVYEFVQNKISIANGNMIVSDSCKAVYVSSGNWWDCYYDKNEGCPFKVGDIVLSKTNGEYKFGRVVSKNDTGIFFIDKVGYTGNPPAAGDLFVRWDSDDPNRKGLLYLNSSDTNAPNFQVVHGGAVKGCFGNCAGLNWQGAPLPANSWGTWIDNGWFNGAVNANIGNIGGFSIDSYQLHTGTNYQGLTPKIRLSNSNAGSSWIYEGERILEGLSLTWHRTNNAGHLVFGQLAANGTTLKDGFKGIQMMDWLGNEYFALGANVNVKNPDSHYCRIAGWNFDTNTIWKGAKYGNAGNGLEIRSEGDWSRVLAKRDDNSYTMLYNYGFNNTFGISSIIGGSTVFELGSSNNIAGWNFDSYHLYSGYVSINANGTIEHTGGKWRFNNNGSGVLAGGNINWDDAGDATFNGTINATAGNFTGTVNAASGNIGGFNISNSILNATGSLMNLSLDAAQGIITLAGKSNWSALTAGIGKYVHPYRPEMVAAAYFKNNVSDASGKIRNVGIIVESSNANNNVSIQAQGNIVCSNDVFGYGYSYYTLSAGAVQPLFIFNSSKFLIKSYGTCQVYIPDVFVVADSLNIKVPSSLSLAEMDDFWITISIVAKYDSAGFYVLTGSNWTGKDRNGNTFTSFLMAGGDSAVLHLIKKGSEAIVQWAATIS